MVPAHFWEHEPVRRALAARHLGRVIRAFRCHPFHGQNPLPQSAVAGWLGITQAQLSRADAATTASDEGGGTTDRRQFHALAALAGIAATGSLDLLATPTDAPRIIGMEQVRFASSLVDEFRRADAAVGADQLCDIAIRVHAHLSSWATKATYSREVGDALQTALADLAIETAWLAIDAGRRPESRPYLNEAITRARIADDPRMEVRALACLSLLIRDDHPGESLRSADAALRSSAGWGTSRLATLLHLRAAHTYATLKDMSSFSRAMAKAHREFDRGTTEDDMPFLHFVTPQELRGIEGLSYLALGRPERAAQAFRTITENPSPTLRRNQIYYTVQLADAQCRQGDLDDAAHTAMSVLPAMGQVSSGRVSRHLAQVRSSLGQPQRSTAATREFTDAYDQAVGR
ncbi:hypothetical protein [Micromonospora rubida]|uniref:hypothetical protein n=1 Tax=Micromonospora rubida TaxID=2697657 RepID=UPI001376D60F|nr:hypothetical protein [Micromonospora rubida]